MALHNGLNWDTHHNGIHHERQLAKSVIILSVAFLLLRWVSSCWLSLRWVSWHLSVASTTDNFLNDLKCRFKSKTPLWNLLMIVSPCWTITLLKNSIMDKLQLTERKLGLVFNSRSGCICTMQLCCYEAKRLNLKLKTWHNKYLGYLPLTIALPVSTYLSVSQCREN